jgi:hypothetical protein
MNASMMLRRKTKKRKMSRREKGFNKVYLKHHDGEQSRFSELLKAWDNGKNNPIHLRYAI